MYKWMLFGLLLLCAVEIRAEVVEGLYAATVPVTDQSADSLKAGASAALAEVIVKVSGSETALRAPSIAAAVKKAHSQVQQFVFSQQTAPDGGLMAKFEFNNNYVTDLVTDAGVPLWTANRPSVLAWVAVESEGERYFVNPSESPEIAAALRQAFSKRGVPLQFPLYDLGDAAAITLDDVWALDEERGRAASERYHTENVLVGKVLEAGDGRWAGDWAYLSTDERTDRSADADTPEAYFSSGASLVAEGMVARYAIAANNVQGGQLRMSVTGIENFPDYAELVNWLEDLELVRQVSLESIEGEQMAFLVQGAIDAPGLAQLLHLNRKLQPADPNSPELSYQWQK